MRLHPGPVAVAAVLVSCTSGVAVDPAYADADRRPVVLELFSSEGCSSCPPADRVASELARAQPVPGAEVLVLEEHVDYWNYLGWEDPFSSGVSTARQRAYADTFGQHGVYTPQMVVDGRVQFLGSDAAGAHEAIRAAARSAKASVRLSRSGDDLAVSVGDLPASGEASTVWLAVTEAGLRTVVPRGENAGATLPHAPVVRRFQKVGAIAAGAATFTGASRVTPDAGWKRENLRAILFVQRDRSREIVGAASIPLD